MPLLHIGGHSGLRAAELGSHLLEAGHVAFVAVMLLVGVSAYRLARRAEARAKIRKDTRHDSR